jgi:hypothetical protein
MFIPTAQTPNGIVSNKFRRAQTVTSASPSDLQWPYHTLRPDCGECGDVLVSNRTVRVAEPFCEAWVFNGIAECGLQTEQRLVIHSSQPRILAWQH